MRKTDMNQNITAVVLAAGKGTRIKAPPTKNKVVFKIADKPIIKYTYEMLQEAGLKNVIVVVGYASDSVRSALGDAVTYAFQENPLGTGHAVSVALPYLPDSCDTVVSMYGDDSAFYPPELIKSLIKEHSTADADLTLVTLDQQNPAGLGRIIRDQNGRLTAIVEEKNATDKQRSITEINTGLYCFKREFIETALKSLQPNTVTGEYYLTDIVGFAVTHNYRVHSFQWPSSDIWFGVNTREQLEEANQRMTVKQSILLERV